MGQDMKRRMTNVMAIVAIVAFAAGCDDTPTDNGDGTIAFTVTPVSATIAQGASETIEGTVTRSGGFSGAVTVTVTGVPSGVTAAVSNAVTTGLVTTADITIAVAAATVPGVYNLTARAQGSGVADATVPLTLTVTEAAAFTFTLSSAAVTIPPGGNSPVTVNLGRTNFTGPVTLALEGAPTGVTGVFNPNPATATSSTLTISVAAGVAAGTHALTVRASAAGLPDQTGTVTLTVSASTYTLSLSASAATVAPGGSQPVTVNLARTNFTGAVALALQGAPSGVTGVFNPSSATGPTSTLTISVAAGTAAGTHTLTVRGTAAGQADKTATIALTISAAASYTLSLNPATLPVVQGTTGNTTVNIARSNFTGAVTLSLAGAPTGVTGAFNPAAPTGNSSTLTVTVGASVAPGTYNLTVNGTGTAGNQSTPLTLTVSASANYQLSLTSAAVTVVQGTTGSTTVNIARTNFTTAVTLSLAGAPTGVTGSFNPAAPTGNTSTLTITVGASVTPGVYNLTVNGAGAAGNRSTPLVLTVTAAANYSLGLSSSALTIAQGASGGTTVNITRTNFTGAVALTLSGAPAGVTGAFNPASATGNTSTLTVTVGASVAAGVYNLTVNGAGTPGARSAALTLTVTATAAANYSLSASPNALSIAQGGSDASTVTITRTNFTGAVALTLGGAPAGVTGSFNPASATGNSSTLTINVGASVAPGTYNLTINGTGTPGSRSTALTLTVTGTGGGTSINLSFAACAVDDRPIWLAVQDGNGAWTRVTGTNNSYSFSITSGRGGFAYVLSASGASTVNVQYFTTAEYSGTFDFCETTTPTLKTINGTAIGIDNTQAARISLGFGAAIATSFSSTFQIMNVQSGTHDLVGYRGALNIGNTPTDRAIIRRDQNIANNGTLAQLDFNGSESFPVASATITVGGAVSGETVLGAVSYQTGASCSAASLYFLQNIGSSFAGTGIPAAQQRATDFHNVFLQAITGTTAYRSVSESFHTFAARTVSLGAAMPTPTITQLSGPYKRLQAVYTLPSGYNNSTSFSYDDGTRFVSISASFAYLGGTSVTLAMPDFSALSGWSNSWAPATSSTVDWVAGAFGFSGQVCAENARTIIATRSGTI